MPDDTNSTGANGKQPEFSNYTSEGQRQIIDSLMALFKGNERGWGWADINGAVYNTEKNKGVYNPGSIGWKWGKYGEKEFRAHLEGRVALGIGPLLDDGTTYRIEIDVDKYELDYAEEMHKIKASGLPLVVNRTKSAGMRIVMFFTEPIDADTARKGAANISAMLGHSGSEIFPKQSKLVKDDDAPSWTFAPYGPIGEVFAEQCGMSDSGGSLTIHEYLNLAESRRISREEFLRLAYPGNRQSANDKANGANGAHRTSGVKKPKGVWVEEETVADTIKMTFKGGPICLNYIAQTRSSQFQHNYLFNVGIFLKRKYPENWQDAYKWVNFNVLDPPGDPEKLMALIKDFKGREYEYRCKDEPICSHCIADACRRMPYGVGAGKSGVDHYEFGLTIIDGNPKRYYVNIGDDRTVISPEEFGNIKVYRMFALRTMASLPDLVPQREWDNVVKRALENAVVIDAPYIMRKNVNELEVLQDFLSIHIPNMIRAHGQEYLDGKVGDVVRLKEKNEMIYFKWEKLASFCRRSMNMQERALEKMRDFIISKGREYGRTELRDWYRSTLAVGFGVFDEAVIDRWLHPDEPLACTPETSE